MVGRRLPLLFTPYKSRVDEFLISSVSWIYSMIKIKFNDYQNTFLFPPQPNPANQGSPPIFVCGGSFLIARTAGVFFVPLFFFFFLQKYDSKRHFLGPGCIKTFVPSVSFLPVLPLFG